MSTVVSIIEDTELVEQILARITSDLALIMDREMTVEGSTSERLATRPAGQGGVHISFRLRFRIAEEESHGALLLKLPDAKAIAGYFMMIPDEELEGFRKGGDLDGAAKDAILEIGNFVASACDAVVGSTYPAGGSVSFGGCQGVRADVRPAFPYEEGAPLLVGRARLRVHTFEPSELILMIPPASPH